MTDTTLETRRGKQRDQRRNLMRSAAVFVLAPTILTALVLTVTPPDFVVDTEFTIQGAEKPTPDLLGGITGLAGKGQADNDARILVDYLKSNAAVDYLRSHARFDQIYHQNRSPIERATDVWRRKLKVNYDGGSQIITVQVKAHRPSDALEMSRGVLQASDNLVNSLASDVGAGGIRYADQQLAIAANAYNQARQKITQTQASSTTLGLDAQAREAINVVGGLDADLAKLRVDAATMGQTYLASSPQMQAMRAQIAALEQQKNAAIARASSAPGGEAAGGDVHTRAMMLDYKFTQRAYYGATQAAQNARQTLETNRRYVVTFVPPRLPQRSNFWPRLANVLTVLIVSALLWGIAALSYSIIKDHIE